MLSYCALVFLICLATAIERPSVTIDLGTINGYHKTSYDGRTYSSFEGIPYAKPPVGNLRFEAPIEPDPWKKALDARNTYECPQINFVTQMIGGSEDCLYLNVYVPKEIPNPNDNMDVIVHIHGGAFMVGNSNMFGPLFFMDRNVVFVNLNYRIGALGFLSTEDDVVPGNNGLKDQNLALQWIQNNIKQFGGNPNSVTITGASAGAASVHFHYFSKLSKGLFHRGVSQSGTTFGPWALQKGALERAQALSTLVGCSDTSTTRGFITCLKTKPSEEIVQKTANIQSPFNRYLIAPFAPVVEKKSKSAFLDEYPMKLLSSGNFNDVPWINSICTDEGSLMMFGLYQDLDSLNDKFNNLAQYYLDYNYTTCDSDKEVIAQKIRKQYFGTEKIGKTAYRRLMELFGDRLFAVSFEKSAKVQASASKSKIYAYIYGYKNSFADSLKNSFGVTDLDLGVGHVEDTHLLYDVRFVGNEVLNSVLSETDIIMKNMMVDMYVSFATGNAPKINGLALDAVTNHGEFTYLSIKSTTDIKMNVTEELTPVKFWESLPIIENEWIFPQTCHKNALKNEL